MISTIQEAKGLEFDTVLVWKFSADPKSAPLWRRILDGRDLERSGHPHLRHEINLLYVAITRARNTLILYDPGAEIWNLPELANSCFKHPIREPFPDFGTGSPRRRNGPIREITSWIVNITRRPWNVIKTPGVSIGRRSPRPLFSNSGINSGKPAPCSRSTAIGPKPAPAMSVPGYGSRPWGSGKN